MNNKNKIIFRADGNKQIGFGHIMRCLHLAEEFAKCGYNIIFLTKNYTESVEKIRKCGIQVCKIPNDCDDNKEIEIIKNVYKKENASALILDKYFDIKQEYLDNLKNNIDKLVVINDYAEIDLKNLFVINVNDNLGYEVHNLSCLGPEYAIIPDKMMLYRKEGLKINEKVETIIISMGGADAKNLTPKVLSFMNEYKKKYNIIVVLGPGYKDATGIEKICSQSNHKIEIVHNTNNIGEHFIRGDIAITSGGVTKYETAFLGIPSIVLCQNDYEQYVTEIFEKYKTIINLGVGEEVNFDSFNNTIDLLAGKPELRMKMSKNGRQCVDGLGKQKIIKRVKKFIELD